MEVKSLITGLTIGFGIGAAAGILYTTKATSKKIEEMANEIADEEVKLFVDEFCKRRSEEMEKGVTHKAELEKETEETQEDKAPYSRYNSLDLMHKPAPQELFKEKEEEQHPQEPEEESDILEEKPDIGKHKDSIYLITEETFDDNGDNKETLYFYQEDQALTNEDDEEVNEYELIGECLDKFDFRNNDQPEIHVRNTENGIDYEVIKMFTSLH